MGKKKAKGDYNDFLDGEKLHDNSDIRTTLQNNSTPDRPIPPRKPQGRKHKPGPKKSQLTHFLCLPLVNAASRPQLEKSLVRLEQDLGPSNLIPPKAIRPAGTLHLTLAVMSLDKPTLQAATHHLATLNLDSLLRDITTAQVAAKAAESGTVAENLNAAAFPDLDALTVELRGLKAMQAPHRTSILYAEPRDATGRLGAFARGVRGAFEGEGLVVADARELRLHATVVNTVYARERGRRGKGGGRGVKQENLDGEGVGAAPVHGRPHHDDDDDGVSTTGSLHVSEQEASAEPFVARTEEKTTMDRSEGHGPDAKSWMRFDARELIARYEDFVWAEGVRIDRVQICKMGAKKVLGAGGEVVGEEYEVVAEKMI